MSYIRELESGKDLMNFLDIVTALRGFVPEIRIIIRSDDGMLRNLRVTYVWPVGEFARIEVSAGEPAKAVPALEQKRPSDSGESARPTDVSGGARG